VKKFLSFLIVSFLLLSSCSEKKDHITKVGVATFGSGIMTNEFITSINQEAATTNDVSFIFKVNKRDPYQQVSAIKELLAENIDILVVAALNDPAVIEILEEVHQKGIKIILIESGENPPFTHYDTKVIIDNYEVGRAIGKYLKERYKGKKVNGLIVRGTVPVHDIQRYEGILQELENQSNIDINSVITTRNNRDTVKVVIDDYLDDTIDAREIDFVYAFNCSMVLGAKDAFVSHNYSKIPFTIGVADFNEDESISMIEESYIDAAVIYNSIGEQVFYVVESLINGEEIDSLVHPQIFVLDQDNVSLYKNQKNKLGDKTLAVESMATQIDSDISSLNKQKQIIFIIVVILLISLFFSVYSRRRIVVEQRLRAHLEEQNIQISKQLKELEEQKGQLVELSKKLEESTQAKLVFFTNISHEFKTPLSLISGPITDLVNRKDLSQDVHSLLDIIYRNSSRLNRLITELIDFRIYESENIVINYSVGDVKEFMMNIASLFEDSFKRRNITFIFDAPQENDYIIPFDPIKLEKIFTNLLSNAFNHVKDNGRIRVSLRVDKNDKEDRILHLSVFNTDSYIPEEIRETIFRRFYTLDNAKGTGIGLALITAIVDAFNGSIKVESDIKEGTKFLIDIPISDMLVTDAKFNSASYEPDFAKLKLATIDIPDHESDIVNDLSSSAKPIALIVEDNNDMRLYLKNILAAEYRVLSAMDGNEGYEKAIKYRPGIIVSDIFMPEKDGFQLCLDVRANEITKNIPILLLTASSSDEQRAKGYECGADAYLQKPFNDQTLKIRMRKLLEKQQKVQEQIDFGFLPNISRSSLNDSSLVFLEKFRAYVEQHIDEEISVDKIAAYFSYSKSKLYRELREVTEYSPIDMVNLIRLKYAIDLMINQNKNITETAFMCGFTSASYFSRVFQKYYNERPLSYLKRQTNINK